MSERPVRLRVSSDRRKSLEQYNELRRGGRVAKAVVLAELKDGSFQVLGQGMSLDEIAGALMIGADAIAAAEKQRTGIKLEAHEEPVRRGEHNMSKPRAKKITKAEDGTLIPPEGENFVSCGECNHPRWYVLHRNADDAQARYSCAHCGNEVESLPIYHREAHA